MAQPPVTDTAQDRPRITAAQWEQIRRLIAELDQGRDAKTADDCQRTAERSAVEFPIHLTVLNQRDDVVNGWAVARNISRGGLSILARRMVHPGSLLTVKLPTPSGPPRRIVARVIRCRYVSELYHEMGISFIESAD